MMATAASRAKALALYRKLLRTARAWPGPAAEKQYIVSRVEEEHVFLSRHDIARPSFTTTKKSTPGTVVQLAESRSQFEANRHLSQTDEIDQKIFEGESRHDIAWHYKIPYPRLHNFPAGSFTENPSRIAGPSFEVPSDEMGSLDEEPTKPSRFKGRLPSSSMRS